MAETKNFKWSIHSIDLERDTIRRLAPQVTLRLDVLEAPGTRASFTDLHNDIMTRFNGVSAIFPDIKNVIFNPPATIVLWSDNSKTVVKVQDGDEFDPEHGLAMAIVKRMYGNTGKYCEIFKKWIKEEEETGWISTKDRMPDKSGDYLVYDLSSRSVYVYEFEIDSIADATHWHNCIPHWMPCPAAPNKKGE